jgi:transposase
LNEPSAGHLETRQLGEEPNLKSIVAGAPACRCRNFELLLDLGPDIAPRAAVTDKGYDAPQTRHLSGHPVRIQCNRPAFFPKARYKARARIEQAVAELKRFKRIALRCEKTATNYDPFVALALG